MNKYSKYLYNQKLTIFIFLSIVTMIWSFLNNSPSETLPKSIKPVRMSIQQETSATGQIQPRMKVKIKSQANGLIEELLVTPGQWVKRGDLLARVRLRADPIEVNISQTQINKAILQNERAFIELERQTHLHNKNIISDAEFQDTKLKYEVTLNDLKNAQRDLELRINGTSGNFKTTSTLITASVNGMILEKFIELGDFVIKANDLSEGTTIFTIADMNNLMFKGEIDEIDAGKLYIGMPLSVKVGALPEETFLAELEFVSPGAKKNDDERNVIEIHAAIKPKKDVTLRAGYSATSHIVLSQHNNVLTIPDSTILFDGTEPYVQIALETGEIIEQKIITGLSNGLHTEIISGINEKDNIVIPISSRSLH